jgi:acyl transferase domain-containing protein/NAD(P)-dependent dehydrogenase (short-subunit alcohol dehydrogenase family)/acyl carrier protein
MQRELHDTVHELLMEKYEPIAIIGIGLRFPGGCESLGEFGEFLRDGRSGVRPIPEDRWDVAAFTPDGPEERGKIRTTSGGFLDRIDLFDAAFFNISPKEAQYIDPQQRMLLETAWQALENANIDPTPLRRGNGGVYIGAGSIDYALEIDALPYTELDGHLASGITMFPLSGRLSYFLGWRGPSISVDTACSSSLVALHLAVQGLRRGECDIALCGGVNALHHPRAPVIFSHAQMLAPDGQCKTFDEAADGYARAEGCGVIVLKRLSVAQRDGDNILAVVLGTAVGQDGDSAGLTVPNGAAQEVVIRNALAAGRLTPSDIQYVEAHGTGTPLGDPIELGAINGVFAQSHTKDEPLLVGSVKTNLGHMEPASGLVGLIKVVSQLRSATIYPHLNLRTPSGRIPWATYPISVPTEGRPWEAPVRRAVVNSFGFAGTIATVAVEQAPPTTEFAVGDSPPEPAIFTVSAKSDAALHDQLKQYQRFLADHPDVDVQRLCYSTNVGRSHFNRRVAAVVSNREDLASVFDREIARTERPAAAGVRKVGFLFSGQGSQYPGMGAALYRRFLVFSERIDECDRLFAPLLGESVRTLLLGEHADTGRIDQTVYTQPALFTLEYALAELWMSWGIRPSVLIGHSIGEVVAATVAGLFSVPDAVTLVAARARLMQSVTEPGGMAAVSAPAEEVVSLLSDHTDLALAAINAPNQCVISGGTDGLAKVVGTLRERAIRVDELSVSHAFHSPLMAEVLDDFRAAIAGISFREPAITLISNLTGKIARRADLANPEYWVRHIGEPVLFMDGMRAAAKRGRHAFLEVGPSTALTALAKQCLPAEDHLWFASLRRRDQVGNATLRSLAELYTAGMPVSWASVHANRRLAKLTLPCYPFQRKRYWLPINGAAKTTRGLVAGGPAHHPLLGQEVPVAAGSPAGSREFITECSAAQPEYLADHVVSGSVMLPAAGYIEALLAAQDAVYGNTGRVIRDLVMHEPLLLAEDTVAELRMRLVPADEGAVDVELVSTVDGQERCHATATLAVAPAPAVPCDRLRALLLDEAGTTEEVIGREDIYTDFDSVDRRYGERFRLLSEVRAHPGGVLRAELDCRAATAVEHLPVEVLDGVMQALSAVDRDGPVFSPTGVEAVRLFKKPRGRRLRLVAKLRAGRSEADERRVADLLLLEGEAPVVELTGVVLTRATELARRRHFMHRLSWLRQSATTQPTVRARHVVVVNGDRYHLPELAEQEDFDHIRVSTVDDVAALATALTDSSVTDVCWFWQLASAAASVDRLRTECEQNYRQLLDVVAVLDGAPPRTALRLWLVTEGAQLLPGDQPDGGERLAATSLWGFGLALLIEYPRYRATLVDLPADGDPSALLAGWRVENTDEFQVAYRDGQRYVRRLLAGDATPALAGEFVVRAPASGDLAELVAVPADEDLPGPGQIQVRVHAAGVNFKDMLLATGALPADADRPAPVLGFECSGTVVATGPGAEFAVGDEVLVHHPGTLRRTVTVPSAVAARKPLALDFTEAAALPAAYVTAFHALHQLADVKPGDRVLVHAAAGGVGQAAVALAKRAGAKVFATASEHKWPLLRDQGVAHVMNSRCTDFADEVLRQTGSRGVDVVLNSLGAGHAEASMRCLATGGRFVELGTTEVYTPDQLHQIRPDIAYHAVDLAGLPQAEQLRLSGELLRSVVDLVNRAELPPLPVTGYSFDEISEAFGVLRRGANIGKVVVRLEAEQVSPDRQTPTELTVRPDRTYLVTGGLGGLGVVTAEKLVDLGARHVVLLSRRGTPTPQGSRVLDALSERAEVTVLCADIGSANDVARVFAQLGAGEYPLGGIVHAAGEIGKSLISSLTWDVIDQQLRSKMYGGWLLHEASRDLPDLDFFVVYSSIAAVTGGMTHQAHYAAANVFLDGLAIWRDRQGLPGLATNWGAWASVGMSAQLDDNFSREMERGGVRFFSPARGLRALGQLLSRPVAQRVVGEYDWDRVAAGASNVNALYSRLARPVEAPVSALDLKELLSKPKAERLAVVTEVVRGKVAAALHCDDAESVDTTAELVSLGLDSLMAMEVKSGLESAFRLALPASLAFDYPSVHQLTEFVNGQLVAELTS